MLDVINSYSNNIIKPVEDYKKELIEKINRKNILYLFNRYKYKKYLKKVDILLYEYYKKLDKIIEEEFNEI